MFAIEGPNVVSSGFLIFEGNWILTTRHGFEAIPEARFEVRDENDNLVYTASGDERTFKPQLSEEQQNTLERFLREIIPEANDGQISQLQRELANEVSDFLVIELHREIGNAIPIVNTPSRTAYVMGFSWEKPEPRVSKAEYLAPKSHEFRMAFTGLFSEAQSGGPVVDSNGKAFAFLTRRHEGLGQAIPLNWFKDLEEKVRDRFETQN